VTTLGAEQYGRAQIKKWIQEFGNGDISCKNVPRAERTSLTFGPQLVASLQKYLFTRARVLVKHFMRNVPTIREMLQRELGLKKSRSTKCPIF
jgi:hypothetical protein